MKTLTALLLSTSLAFAGGLPTEFPAEAQVERPAHLGSNADWLVPLLLIGIVAIAVSGHDEPKPCGEECSPNEPINKKDRLDDLYGNHDWRNYEPTQRQCVVAYYRTNGADGDWSTYEVCK